MASRKDRDIFSRKPRKRGISKWAIGAATILIGIAISAPTVAAKDCSATTAPCDAIALDNLTSSTEPSQTTEAKLRTDGALTKQSAKRRNGNGRRQVTQMTIIGLLLGGGDVGIGLK